ncbi:MAG TPA: flagellar motor switch protein FliN [Bdellovibrionota bacterium]|jgi:flagellar motor switch protein FliN/FliY|nr:flagellar motor switch protein FliN [Bdellovibrionota bacterium]
MVDENDVQDEQLESAAEPEEPSVAEKGAEKLDLILDIPLKLSVEVGRAKIIVNDLLKLGQGSVIELSKLAGDPLEVLVNDKLIARGEVVVVNEKFGVRLTDIISPVERIEKLG